MTDKPVESQPVLTPLTEAAIFLVSTPITGTLAIAVLNPSEPDVTEPS